MTKIIHCADLHLDSKMESNLPRKLANMRRAEIRDTFANLVKYAKENDYRVIIIAGDMFDEERCSATTAEFLIDVMSSAPEIDFLYLKGNHDRCNLLSMIRLSEDQLPANLKVFSDSWVTYDYGDVAISGVEFSKSNFKTIYRDYAATPERVNIVVLHGQLATSPGLDAICVPQLEQKQIDYLALGHIHSHQKDMLGRKGQWCYPGCLEGRGFDECGKKGFVSIDIDEGKVVAQFVPFAKRSLHEIGIDITGLITFPQIRKAMEDASRTLPQEDMVKFVLQGQCEPEANKDLNALSSAFNDRFFFVKVKDESTMKIDPADYENDISLRGEYVRTVLALDGVSESEKSKILICGLRALSGEDVVL